MAALAIVGVDGHVSTWLGSHHGRVPAEALDGLSAYSFAETPLFAYLYFTTEIPNGRGTALVASLMKGCHERGKMAGWIAPPPKGINDLPVDYEYVKL